MAAAGPKRACSAATCSSEASLSDSSDVNSSVKRCTVSAQSASTWATTNGVPNQSSAAANRNERFIPYLGRFDRRRGHGARQNAREQPLSSTTGPGDTERGAVSAGNGSGSPVSAADFGDRFAPALVTELPRASRWERGQAPKPAERGEMRRALGL